MTKPAAAEPCEFDGVMRYEGGTSCWFNQFNASQFNASLEPIEPNISWNMIVTYKFFNGLEYMF